MAEKESPGVTLRLSAKEYGLVVHALDNLSTAYNAAGQYEDEGDICSLLADLGEFG